MTKQQPSGYILASLVARKPEIEARFGVERIGVFGSCARGEASPASDVDVLVSFRTPSFDGYMDLKFFLEDLFGRSVDLVLADSIKPRIRQRIRQETVYA